MALLPNRNTLGLGAVLLAMLYAGVSQNNAAAYLLAFLLVSIFAVSALHAWANLRGLELRAEPIAPVFEGEPLVVPLVLRASAGRTHYGLCLSGEGAPEAMLVPEVAAGQTQRAEILLPPRARGRFAEVKVEVSSVFPLGFLTARRRVPIAQAHYVYPRAEGEIPLPLDGAAPLEVATQSRPEGDDFAGVRDWQMGQSMRHVDWKAYARGQRLLVKQWAGGVGAHFVFASEQLPELETEPRLRQLARWVVQAERNGGTYELRLAEAKSPAGQGEAHFHACLRRLADSPRTP